MTTRNLQETLVHEDASQAWDLLSQQVEALVEAWEQQGAPPDLAVFLPERPAVLRRMVLIELIKVDLEYRWKHPEHRWTIEQYLAAFPELQTDGQVPPDLVYEEYHIRKQAGDTIQTLDYAQRFPQQADELNRLLGVEAAHVTTMLVSFDRAEDFQPGQRVDDFELLVCLGRGAFGTVFLARQVSMQRMVALKVTADRGNEPQTMAMLDHPHIVRVYDQRQLIGRPLRLLYMQYVPGGTLQSAVDKVRTTAPALRSGKLLVEVVDGALDARGEALPAQSRLRAQLQRSSWPEAVCWLGARLGHALDYAHQRGVLHRDVKPANVLLAADCTPKLADFNISFCAEVEGATPAAYFGGSLAYMSPEQLEACHPAHPRSPSELDGRSDVYSLGVMLWELLTGARPFLDEGISDGWTKTLDAMIARRQLGVGPSARALLPADCPPGVEQVLLRCLEHDCQRRYAAAGEAARQLELCLQPEVQRLLRPQQAGWIERSRQMPLTALFAAALVPNIACSLLNIGFNLLELVKKLETHLPQALPTFKLAIAVVNPVLYGIAIVLILRLARGVIRAVRRRQRNEPVDHHDLSSSRVRCTWLGDYTAWTAAVLWVASGLIFPTWMHGHLRYEMGADALVATGFDFQRFYLGFIVSQVLSGLVAAMLTFYLVAVVCMRGFYPVLVQPEAADLSAVGRLGSLVRRTRWYLGLAVAGPFLALGTAVFADVDKGIFLGLFLVGLGSLAACWWLAGWLNADAEALVLAETPAGSVSPGLDTGTESFWTRSQ